MRRAFKILRNAAIALCGLIVVLAIIGILVVQSAWFQNYVKQIIVTSTEDSTGGKVEMGTFHFEWTHMIAVATDFVIHGTEAAGAAPLLRVARVQLNLHLFTSLHHFWEIAYLGVNNPQANVIVYPDGHTNIPAPRHKSTTNGAPLETVMDLAIGRFELTNGLIAFAAQKQELNIRGNNLRAQLAYNVLSQDYTGKLSLQPIYLISGKNTPVNITVNLPLTISRNRIDVHDASIFSSASSITLNASIQNLKDPKLSAHATGHIALADLSIKSAKSPSVIDLDANVSSANNTIGVTGLRLSLGHSTLEASGSLNGGLSFQSRLSLGELGRLLNQQTLPNDIANLSGTATLDSQNSYRIRGDLKNFNLRALSYDGVLSGPIDITGNLNAGLRGLIAQAKFSIAPRSRAIPVSGRLNATYSGARDDVSIQKSLLTLPHSQLSIDGSLGKQLNVALTTTNLDDLFAVVPQDSRPAVALHAGEASFTGKVTGNLTAPSISGHVTASRFSVAGRQFDSFDADASATKHAVAIQNGALGRNNMQARFSGTLGLQDWKALPSAPVSVSGSIQNGDLADLLALAGQPSGGYSGQLVANVSVSGTLGNPTGNGSVVVTNGRLHGQPFDRAEGQVNLTDQLLTVPAAFLQLGTSRVNLKGEFRHPRDSFSTGQLHADIQSDQIDLAQVSTLQKHGPNTAGMVQLNADVTGNLSGQLQLTTVNGHASVRGLRWEGQNYGDLTATATTSGQTVNYNLTSNFAGSNVRIDGSTQLTGDYTTTALANFGNLQVEKLLAAVGRTDIPVKGLLSGTANLFGTIANPRAVADLTLTNGTLYDDVVDRVHLTANYNRPANASEPASLQFRVDTTNIDLARAKTLTEKLPGLAGTLQLEAAGDVQIRPSDSRILVRNFSGNLKSSGLALNGKHVGDFTLAANTVGGRTNLTLNAGPLEGHGFVQLTNDYPADAQLTFKNITWSELGPLLGYNPGEGRGVEASGDGQVSVSGPLMNLQQLRGSVRVTRLQVSGAASSFGRASVSRKSNTMLLENRGPITATLDHGSLKIENAHLAGAQTDLQATGTVPLDGRAMDIALNGNVNLAILEQFDQSITSSGNIVLAAGVRGLPANPRLTGQLEFHNAAFNYVGMSTGISKANGVVALNGNSAVIRNLTAEAGGGQVVVTGSASLNGGLRFGLQAKASRVRLQLQQGVGVTASANMNLSGTAENSSVSGTVTVEQVSYATRSDLGSLLSLAAPPVQSPSVPSPLFENMRLDVRVRSSNALGVQSSLAQNVQLTADLRMRGSVAHPAILGRVLITEGELVFFGSTYKVNSGSIAFYNPVRIEPILDLSLETKTQGVDVVLKVTGPIDNMKLSYTSDPPLQFQEIVNLLATGTTPTSDPTLLANSPQLPAQNFQQLGESAIVGRALADPVSNQLQRVFGVTQLKINPAFTSGSQLPEAQLTLQQQISNNVTFTYVTGLNTANAQTIQAVWTFAPQWSVQALRDYNGILSVTLIYKQQIR